MTPDSGPLAHVTAADVLRWGRAQPADTVVGVCKSEVSCLIAQYASTVLDTDMHVMPGPPVGPPRPSYWTWTRTEHALPHGLNALALAFDDLVSFEEHEAHDISDPRFEMHPADLDRLEATP